MDTLSKSRSSSEEMEDIELDAGEAVPTKEAEPATEAESVVIVKDGWFSPQARFVARRPLICFWLAFLIAAALSVVGLYLGDFQVAADNAGWQTRGTLIANRNTQVLLVLFNKKQIFL